MHEDYKSKNTENLVTYELYSIVVNEKNISFAKLGEEECKICLKHDQHMKDVHSDNGPQDDCNIYQGHLLHKQRYTAAWELCRKDAEKKWPREVSVQSVY